jgi:hypothetical protein
VEDEPHEGVNRQCLKSQSLPSEDNSNSLSYGMILATSHHTVLTEFASTESLFSQNLSETEVEMDELFKDHSIVYRITSMENKRILQKKCCAENQEEWSK